jgi:hypothetical protein
MIAEHISLILYVLGGATSLMLLQFLAPRSYLRIFHKLTVEEPHALFFARHWGLVIGLFGVLLIWAGHDPAIRTPIVATAALGKAALVVMILANRKSFTRGYLHVAAFDAVCSVIFVLYLAGW